MHSLANFAEQAQIVPLFQGTPSGGSGAAGRHVSLKGYGRATIAIIVNNGATVTGSAVTLEQATAVDGSDAKALAFDRAWAAPDIDTSGLPGSIDVTSNTFTTTTTDNDDAVYMVEVPKDMLDAQNGFDCIGVNLGNAANTEITAVAIMWPANHAPLAIDALAD